MDIKSGRIRYTRHLFYCKISEKIEDTILTEAIGDFAEDVQTDWRRVSTFSLGFRHSTYYVYNGAIFQILLVAMIWEMSPFSDEAKRHMAQTILDKWQADGVYFGVSRYLMNVSTMAEQRIKSDPNAIISVSDLLPTQDIQEILQTSDLKD